MRTNDLFSGCLCYRPQSLTHMSKGGEPERMTLHKSCGTNLFYLLWRARLETLPQPLTRGCVLWPLPTLSKKKRPMQRFNYSRLCTAVRLLSVLVELSTKSHESFSDDSTIDIRKLSDISNAFDIFGAVPNTTAASSKWVLLLNINNKSSHKAKNCWHCINEPATHNDYRSRYRYKPKT